ncbi:MAG: transporter substrate-binding domain-containing protein [Pseudomonadota bacterium]
MLRRSGHIIAVIVFALLMGPITAQAQSQPTNPDRPRQSLILACNPFPPSKIANTLSNPGYDIEILRAAFAVSHISLQTPFYPWKRALMLAETGQVDGLCSCSWTPDRTRDMLFSNELGKIRIGLFATSDRLIGNINRLEDAKNIHIGVIAGYNLEQTARDAGLDVQTANGEDALLKMLYGNRIDAIYSFRAPIVFARQALGEQWGEPGPLSYQELVQAPYYSCISKHVAGAEWLLKRLNIGLETVRENGIYDSILEKYGVAEIESLKKRSNWFY